MESYMDKSNMNTVTVQCGVDYATVESRVRAFCSEHPSGQILTEMVKCEDDTGEVIFKAHAVVDGLIRGTGHAMEMRGSNNVNKTSHIECAETSAVGRCLAFGIGLMSSGAINSYEEIENAKLQQSNIELHEKTLTIASGYVSKAFINAIENDDEEQILECQAEMRGNDPLRQAVNETLSSEHKSYLIERQKKISAERNERNAKLEAKRRNYAKEFVEKQKKKNLNG
jgi:hypothetical protein